MSLSSREIDKFNRNLDILLSHHQELKLAIHNKKNEESLKSELVSQFILSVSVLWQSFMHDLLIAYILMDPSRAIESIKSRLSQSVESKFGAAVSKNTMFVKPKKLSRSTIIALLDPKGWNISVSTADKLSNKANDLLVSRYAIKFSLDSGNSEFFDYMVVFRNFLSHHSLGGRKELVEKINNLSDPVNNPLKGKFSQPGSYLKAIDNNISRAEFIIERLRDISHAL